MPLFDVPDAPDYSLDRAPLVQALAQVRYPLVASFETLAGVAPLQEALRAEFPYMEQERVQEIALVAGPAGPSAGSTAESINWRITNDEGMLLVVGAGSATLSADSNYRSVGSFSHDFRTLLDALLAVRVARCDRLGVRYLSLAEGLPGDEWSWRRWFKPEVLGWAGSDVVSAGSLANCINQVTIGHLPVGDLAGPPAEVQATVRHGFVPKGTLVPGIPPIQTESSCYLLDLDVFVAGHQAFDPDALIDQFNLFHDQIDRFFYWSLTQEGGEHFGLEVRSR